MRDSRIAARELCDYLAVEMLTRMARESGIETPTAEDLVRLDRNRKGEKLSNAD